MWLGQSQETLSHGCCGGVLIRNAKDGILREVVSNPSVLRVYLLGLFCFSWSGCGSAVIDAYLSASPAQRVTKAAQPVKHARAEAELLRSLTVTGADALIEQACAAEADRDEARRAAQEWANRYDHGHEHHHASPQSGPRRGLS